MANALTPSRDIARLIEIMAALRTPKTGCPWDLEQTFKTIAPYTIEEAYEVADAIERGDTSDLKDELGDLLLQVVYHARLAEEQGAFSFADVVEGITKKMIRRHPHVFGGETAANAGDVKGMWDKIKAEEKAEKAADERASVLADVPAALPALTRAIKLQDKAAKVGFDWPGLIPVFDKVKEELAEFEEVALPAASGRLSEVETDAAIQEEFGDLLFVLANVARHLKIDPEACLRGANQKFIRRFGHIETRLAEKGSSPAQSSLEEMDAFWDEAKFLEQMEGE
jgi:ATP diphosphatase